LAVTLPLCFGVASIQASSGNLAQGLSEPLDYAEIIRAVDVAAIEEHMRFLSSFTSRSIGYPGFYMSAEYVFDEFVEAGLQNVSYDEFRVPEAIDHGANVTVLSTGEIFTIFPMKPNFGAPSTTPPGGVSGKLIYARKGHLSDFDGLDAQGSIVLLDWDTGLRWINAAKLGARAVIFLPSVYVPDIAVPRTIQVPFAFPRFCVDEEGAGVLLQHLDEEVKVVARTYWENVRGLNVVGFLEGTGTEEEKGKIIILSSYFDSGSIAPSWAPGAEESMGIASLIEYARWLSRNPPRYTVMFVAYSGHHNNLAGAMKFLEHWAYPAYDLTKREVGIRFIGQYNLDLSGGSDVPYITLQGAFMHLYGGYRDSNTQAFLRDFVSGTSVYGERGIIEEIRQGTQKQYKTIVDAYGTAVGLPHNEATPYEGTRYEYMTGMGRNYDSEPLNSMFDNLGITITTAYDPRFSYERPWDTFDRLTDENFDNLKTQLELTYCLLARILTTQFDVLRPAINYANWLYPPRYDRVDVENRRAEAADQYWRAVMGQVGYYNTTKAWYEPVPNALVYFRPSTQYVATFSAERWPIYAWAFADENGYFEIWGAGASTGGPAELYAFVFDNDTGAPVYVPDYGLYQFAPRGIYTGGMQIAFYEHFRVGWVAVFEAATAVVFDTVDPTTFSPPRIFGTAQTLTVIPSLYETAGHIAQKQSSSVIFSFPAYSMMVAGFPPSLPSEIVIASPTVWRYPIAFLVNATEGRVEGYTFEAGEQYLFDFSILQFAENLYGVSKDRLDLLTSYSRGVLNFPEYGKSEWVSELITKAREAYEGRRYSEAYRYASEAWRFVRDVYFFTRTNMEDVSFAVPILSAFLIPFVVVGEKLMVNATGRKKVASLVLLMTIILVVFYFIHPGFSVAASPPMIVIGFSILTLILPIALITFGGGLSAIKFIRVRLMGMHEIEVARTSMAIWSFGIGIENMRKRKFRTTLVLISLLLMVVAFTNLASLRGIRVIQPTLITGNPLYNGVYLHRNLWGQGQPELGEILVEILRTKYEGQAEVVPRAWVYTDVATSTEGQFGFRLVYNGANMNIPAILGFAPNEVDVTGLDVFLGGNGTWFQPGQRYVCILPSSVANRLGISGPGVEVDLFTRPVTVIGIIDDEFSSILELDGERITPIMMNYPGRNPFNTHVSPAETILMPWDDVLSFGGQVASISVKVSDASATEEVAMEVFDLVPDIFTFASYNDQVVLLARQSVTTAMGLEAQIVPFIMLALSILSIMLGNVYERIKEIGVYSVVGLSPMHVAFMFLSESITYALVGGILGYILGMAVNVVVSAIAPGAVIQNIFSSSLIYALLISMLAMVLSSIYPLFKASRLVTPSLERKWSIKTKPVDDNWSIPLPFYTTSTEEVGGIISFLREFFSAHVGESPPGFSVLRMELEEGELEGEPYKGIHADVRVAPYESGVHQTVRLLFKKVEKRWEMLSLVRRLSGAPPEWVKLNTRFTDDVRKQVLLWRSMTEEARKSYIDRRMKGEEHDET